jgi:hypothetical protein
MFFLTPIKSNQPAKRTQTETHNGKETKPAQSKLRHRNPKQEQNDEQTRSAAIIAISILVSYSPNVCIL